MNLGLEGKKVFITASSRGIGLATAKAFLDEGCSVVINGRDEERLRQIIDELAGMYPSRIAAFSGDMLHSDDITKAVEYVTGRFGSLDILVSNLGSGKPESNDCLDAAEWDRFFRVNTIGSVEMLNGFYDLLKMGTKPCVILVSSIVAKEAASAPPGYAASKSAVLVLNKYLSRIWASDGIRVNCVLPGNVFFDGGRWQELHEADPEGVDRYISEKVPMNRFGRPEEIADSIVFLASEKASFITGAELVIDGGQLGTI